jgi:hypothetical protein
VYFRVAQGSAAQGTMRLPQLGDEEGWLTDIVALFEADKVVGLSVSNPSLFLRVFFFFHLRCLSVLFDYSSDSTSERSLTRQYVNPAKGLSHGNMLTS